MEKICSSIAERISEELNLDKDNKEVIAYGMISLLQIFFSIGLVIIFGILFNVLIEALIISFTSSILRKYSGGVHASSPLKCALIGTIVCIGQAVIVSQISTQNTEFMFFLMVGLGVFTWSSYMIYKLAPVDSPAKPIKKEEKRKRMKRGSIKVLGAYLIIVVVNFMAYYNTENINFLRYCLCIYIGIIWQVFTITTYGHVILGKIDTFFTHILNFGEGEK